MSEQTNDQQNDGADDLQIDELGLLKQRAKMLGITFSNNISVETLKEKITAKLEGDQAEKEVQPQSMVDPAAPQQTAKQKTLTLRNFMIQENMRLIRVRIMNLDPKKKDLPGEFLTVANEYLGTVTKYVPFGDVTENGYHVPYCIYKMMKNRKFLNIRTYKDRKNDNQIKVEQRWASEFALEVLDPLTPQELAKLAAAQTAAGSMN